MKEKEAKLIDYQNILSIIFIGTIIVSMITAYDEKLRILNQKRLFNKKTASKINFYNRLAVVIIAGLIVYINIIDYNNGIKKGANIAPLRHQVEASVLNSISTVIVLYVLLENNNFNIFSIENPTI